MQIIRINNVIAGSFSWSTGFNPFNAPSYPSKKELRARVIALIAQLMEEGNFERAERIMDRFMKPPLFT